MADLGMAFLNPILASDENDRREAKLPSDIAHAQALTRLANAQAGAQEDTAAAERQVGAVMARVLGDAATNGTPLSDADFFRSQAAAYSMAGRPKAAQDAMKQADVAQFRERRGEHFDAIEADHAASRQLQAMDRVNKVLQGVRSQEDWDGVKRAYPEIFRMVPGLATMPYSPEFVQSLQESVTTAHQRAMENLRERDIERKERADKDKAYDRVLRRGLAERGFKLRQEREERLAKVGGKDVGAPGAGEVGAARTLLRAQKELVGDIDVEEAGFDLASQARSLRKANPGMTADEALRSTLDQMKKRGDFVEGKKGGWFEKDTPAFYQGGAIPLPKSGKVDDLVEGRRYIDGSGRIMTWGGKKGWQAAAAAAAKPGSRAAPSKDDDEEDDDDE